MTPEQSKTLKVGDRVCINDDPADSGKVTSVYGFLTTAPNAVVEQIDPKAMPVILTTEEECDAEARRRSGSHPARHAGKVHNRPLDAS